MWKLARERRELYGDSQEDLALPAYSKVVSVSVKKA
jgi:hypothetical protein